MGDGTLVELMMVWDRRGVCQRDAVAGCYVEASPLCVFRVVDSRCLCACVQVMSVAFSPDGRSIVSGSYDETLIVW